MKKVLFITALLLVSAVAIAAQTSVWRSTLVRGSTFVQNVDATTPEAALQACHLLVPNSATTLTEYTCNSPKRVYRVTPNCTVPAPRPGTCPAGTTGTWTQTATVGPWPSCTVTWSIAPVGACVPISASDGTAQLNWEHDGARLSGFRILYGSSQGALTRQIDISNPGIRAYTVTGLAAGTHYFAVVAKGACSGTVGSPVDPYTCVPDSDRSNIVSKVVL